MNWRAISGGLLAVLLAMTLCACGSSDAEAPDELEAEETTPTIQPLPDLTNMTLGAAVAAVEGSGRVSYVFGMGVHAYSPGVAPGTAGFAVTEHDTTGTAVYIRVGSDDSTPTVAEPTPWWYEGHWGTVQTLGASGCFECHDEPYCTACHVQNGVDELSVQKLAIRDDLPYEVSRPLAVLGSSFVLKGVSWSYEDAPTFALEGPNDEDDAREALLIALPRVFAEQTVTPSVIFDFYERGEEESFLHVEILLESGTDVDWEAVTSEELPELLDSYQWK